MRACVMVEPQEGMSYDKLLEIARKALSLGLEGTFRSDHYQPLMSGPTPEPSTDAWATLAGLVRDLPGGCVGTLVSPVTFRHPAQLAKVVATVAHMSAGPTVELGLGTGWNEAEHRAYGFPFGTFDERFRTLAEYLPLVRALLSGEQATIDGERFRIDACRSMPAAPGVRIIVGGLGLRRTPRLAALYADELNLIAMGPEPAALRVQACRELLEGASRDAANFTFSWMGQFLIGRSDADLRDRAARLGASRGADADQVLGRLRGLSPVGTVSQAAEFLESLAEVGIRRVMLQHLLTDDEDHLVLAAEAAREALVV